LTLAVHKFDIIYKLFHGICIMRRRTAPLPNKAFFESHPRAALLRGTGLAGAESFQAVVQGNEEAVGPLMDANQRLRGLGIVAGMHIIKGSGWRADRQRYRLMASPVKAAEFACSQLVNVFDKTIHLSPPDPSLFREHDLFGEEFSEAVMFDSKAISARLHEFRVGLGATSTVIRMLDGQQPSDHQGT
jgi:hypothetical protein